MKYTMSDLFQGMEGGYDGFHEFLYQLEAEDLEARIYELSQKITDFKKIYGESPAQVMDWNALHEMQADFDMTCKELERAKKEMKRYTSRVKKAQKTACYNN